MNAKIDSWDKKNARRVALIHKEIAGQLSKDEACELQELQDLADARVHAILDRDIKAVREEAKKRGIELPEEEK